ncbi:MAG: alpha/beta hydrolase [Myxococcota bacterium]|nr:alpha/beta hydrolase [Myxococcota bacterium]
MRLLLPVLLLSTGCSLSKIGMHAIAWQAHRTGMEAHTLVAGEHTVRYWMGGQGPPVLLIHGFGGDGLATWSRQLDDFTAEHTVIVPDLLWFGASHSQAQPTLTHQAEAQLALLDALELTAVDVVGISYGGFVTLRLYQLAEDRFNRLVIVDSPGPLFSDEDAEALADRFGVAEPEELFVPQTPAAVGALIGLAYYEEKHYPRFLLRDIQRNLFADHHDALRGLLADLSTNRDLLAPSTLTVPPASLVVWGSHDRVFPPPIGASLAELLDAELVTIQQAAHAPQIERPESFNQAVLEYLR